MTGEVVVLGAPSSIGLVPHDDGTPRRIDLAAAALREQGLVERLAARDAGDVEPPPRYRDVERPAHGARNEEDVAAYARDLGKSIAKCRRERRFVLLLGGDCGIVLGALLGVRDATGAAPGLVYIDAHADFATLDESPSASACSMALGLAFARDDQRLARLGGDVPLVARDRIAHVGRRDDGPQQYGDAALGPSGVLELTRTALVERGAAAVAADALQHVAGGGFWIHFDVDVLDPGVFSATGDPAPNGIDLAEAAELLAPLVSHPAALGLQVTLYDPTLDNERRDGARDLAEMLVRSFEGRGAG